MKEIIVRDQVKVLLVGDTGSGKTCLVRRLCDGDLVGVKETIGVDIHKRSKDGKEYKLFDVSGHKRFISINQMYLNNTDILVLVVDRNKENLFREFEHLIDTFVNQKKLNNRKNEIHLIPVLTQSDKQDEVDDEALVALNSKIEKKIAEFEERKARIITYSVIHTAAIEKEGICEFEKQLHIAAQAILPPNLNPPIESESLICSRVDENPARDEGYCSYTLKTVFSFGLFPVLKKHVGNESSYVKAIVFTLAHILTLTLSSCALNLFSVISWCRGKCVSQQTRASEQHFISKV